MNNYGWKGTFKEFSEVDKDHLVNQLSLHIYNQTVEEAQINPAKESTLPQIRAWYDCIRYLQEELPYFQHLPGFLIFEYEIVRSGRKRPDVLLFLPGEVLVLEFKSYSGVDDAEYTQTSLYIRDLQQYHSAIQTFSLQVRGALVVTKENRDLKINQKYQIYQLGRGGLRVLIDKIAKRLTNAKLISDLDFLEGVFQPLPSIIESARAIMREEDLPKIKTLKSSNFDTVVNEVKSIVELAKKNRTHHLILVSGVPGAGKTFVGLTLAHEIEKAIYLSGNGPLVDVLQDSLKNKTFVQALYDYKTDFLNYGKVPEEQVIIFDEAQRAWDAKKMKKPQSEPDVIIQIAKHKPWSVVVGLIGEGQEIHLGEEGGIGLWNHAIHNENIHVHAKHHQHVFPNALTYHENKDLHLNTSLRTHKALQYFEWVEAFISGDFEHCKTLEKQLANERFMLKVVNSLAEAKLFVEKLYEGTNKTYGIVVSSGIKNPKGVKVVPFSDRNVHPKYHVQYFNYPESNYYCRNLKYAATEFQVQGLELDMAIVYWGEDLQWTNTGWKSSQLKHDAEDPHQLKLNAYRVLLTRGRDGVVICSNNHF
ncbi:DNA/RNA helicase domain-containing protein [Niallia oryzisoli]|uniref:DNA/RNA helicase domain-containing protein n=1 Tax=Niallia oryzisoli TaxID=1737571 RepID=A0ABZ2CJ20_9BACI